MKTPDGKKFSDVFPGPYHYPARWQPFMKVFFGRLLANERYLSSLYVRYLRQSVLFFSALCTCNCNARNLNIAPLSAFSNQGLLVSLSNNFVHDDSAGMIEFWDKAHKIWSTRPTTVVHGDLNSGNVWKNKVDCFNRLVSATIAVYNTS